MYIYTHGDVWKEENISPVKEWQYCHKFNNLLNVNSYQLRSKMFNKCNFFNMAFKSSKNKHLLLFMHVFSKCKHVQKQQEVLHRKVENFVIEKTSYFLSSDNRKHWLYNLICKSLPISAMITSHSKSSFLLQQVSTRA
jgi:hypothetical protein